MNLTNTSWASKMLGHYASCQGCPHISSVKILQPTSSEPRAHRSSLLKVPWGSQLSISRTESRTPLHASHSLRWGGTSYTDAQARNSLLSYDVQSILKAYPVSPPKYLLLSTRTATTSAQPPPPLSWTITAASWRYVCIHSGATQRDHNTSST